MTRSNASSNIEETGCEAITQAFNDDLIWLPSYPFESDHYTTIYHSEKTLELWRRKNNISKATMSEYIESVRLRSSPNRSMFSQQHGQIIQKMYKERRAAASLAA